MLFDSCTPKWHRIHLSTSITSDITSLWAWKKELSPTEQTFWFHEQFLLLLMSYPSIILENHLQVNFFSYYIYHRPSFYMDGRVVIIGSKLAVGVAPSCIRNWKKNWKCISCNNNVGAFHWNWVSNWIYPVDHRGYIIAIEENIMAQYIESISQKKVNASVLNVY